MSKMWNLSRKALREAITETVEADEPIRHRWLQEHPRSNEILNQLTTEALQMMSSALRERSLVPQRTTFWSTPDEIEAEVQTTVIDMLLGVDGLWSDLADEFPREAPKPTALEVTHARMATTSIVPRSAPIDRGSHQAD